MEQRILHERSFYIWNLLNEPSLKKFDYKMITSVRLCLSHELLTVILSLSKFVYFNENLHCCNGRRHDIT